MTTLIGDKSQSMNTRITVVFAVLCCSIPLHGQTRPFTNVPFAGCYEIVSQKWNQSNEDIGPPIPGRFELRSEPADKRSANIFQMRSIPAGDALNEMLWLWQPKGDHLWLSWGTGLGGIRGTLTQSRDGEFVGKVKEWCDKHCEWKIRARRFGFGKLSALRD